MRITLTEALTLAQLLEVLDDPLAKRLLPHENTAAVFLYTNKMSTKVLCYTRKVRTNKQMIQKIRDELIKAA